mmetsp:Transcript_13318/g.26300  ORF Transcript_13318/g.26300 Transcript_13318/m.26300 type:complete len:1193 (-) Transcript_13318:1456-5034(-)
MLGKSDFHSTSKSGPMHLHSADLFGAYSPQQIHRQSYRPHVPAAYKHQAVECFEEVCDEIEQEDPEQLAKALPQLFGTKYCEVRQAVNAAAFRRRPLRVGVVLSGGPAPGGHNVIAGLFDFLRKVHPESKLFGFMGGMDGFFNMKYKTITPEHMARFRNSGGFDMLWSGRGRVNGRKDMDKAVEVAKSLEMTGLVVVGGDGSCSNAALLANHMAEFLPSCSVVGVPKTIDGDLKNAVIESSFGFDTASKTYSELIGNLCVDVGSSKHTYHFVRVMGRSASHLVLECALQTRPNLCLVGEEIERNNTSLKEIVQEIVELIAERKKKGVNFGVLLVPEGLIEFIPEIKKLIAECNEIVKKDGAFDKEKLSDEGRGTWDFLPEVIQDQLLMEREATGYIQVAKVATERLLILLVKNQLYAEGIDQETHPEVSFMPHYFGYEGRCAMPSNFDANYCFSLGLTAGALIQNKRNGYMSLVRNLSLPTADWSAAGIPIVQLMKMYGKKGEEYPGVTKQLVDLDGPLFQVFKQARALWKYGDMYRNPGPIQFDGPVADGASYTVCIPVLEELISYDKCEESRSCFRKSQEVLSPLQLSRLRFKPEMNSLCMDQKARARQGQQFVPQDPYTLRQILLHYPQLCNHHQFAAQEVLHDKYTSPILTGLRVGVVFMSRQAPGITNILWGLFERLSIVGGSVIGFKNGLNGLLESDYIEVERTDLDTSLNQGGMEFLGRSLEHTLMNVENMERARQTCEEMRLDGLVVVGSAYTLSEATLFSEYLLQKSCSTSVIGIPATGSNNVAHELLESCLGFDSTTKVYASLIGNILTDAASMPKYWHFIRLMGRDPSHEVMECALQTHPNFVIIAEEYGAADKTLVHIVQDIADVVCRRAEAGKNFGTVLIPEGLLLHLPNMRNLMAEVNAVVKEAREKDRIKEMRDAMVNIEDGMNSETHWAQLLTPWSLALFKSFPKFIRKELVTSDAAETKLTHIETEELVAQMVKKELEKRKKTRKVQRQIRSSDSFLRIPGEVLPSLCIRLPPGIDTRLPGVHSRGVWIDWILHDRQRSLRCIPELEAWSYSDDSNDEGDAPNRRVLRCRDGHSSDSLCRGQPGEQILQVYEECAGALGECRSILQPWSDAILGGGCSVLQPHPPRRAGRVPPHAPTRRGLHANPPRHLQVWSRRIVSPDSLFDSQLPPHSASPS